MQAITRAVNKFKPLSKVFTMMTFLYVIKEVTSWSTSERELKVASSAF